MKETKRLEDLSDSLPAVVYVGALHPFTVPEPLREILPAWHVLHGRPTLGPVFPVTKGPPAGQHRVERGTSYAARLRRELWRLGIRDHAIHNDTPVSKKVDSHSFRRAFATSLAEAGINEQRAMMLTAHSDSKVHARYVQETAAMREIPEGAVPSMPLFDTERIVTTVTEARKSAKKVPKRLLESWWLGALKSSRAAAIRGRRWCVHTSATWSSLGLHKQPLGCIV